MSILKTIFDEVLTNMEKKKLHNGKIEYSNVFSKCKDCNHGKNEANENIQLEEYKQYCLKHMYTEI